MASRILLVEDSRDQAALVIHQLKRELGESLQVLHVESLAAARQALDSEVDCVLLDLGLPDAAGLDALVAVIQHAPRVPVVVLSAEESEELAVRAVNEGAQDYLVKRHAHGPLLARAIRYAIERKRGELELAHRATHDPLTGLPNRALLFDRLELTLARLERRSRGCAVLFLDLDGFKEVNDRNGHDVGDALLVAVACRLAMVVRPSDTVARLGGDEFVVLCDDLLDPEQADVIADRIVESFERPFEADGREYEVGVSIGIAHADGRGVTAAELIRQADEAMFAVKQAGGGRRM